MSLTIDTFNSYANSKKYLYFQIKANEINKDILSEMEENSLPIEINICVDRSGSMYGDKITNVIDTLNFLVEQLRDKDKLGLVIFDDRIENIPPEYMTSINKIKMRKIINNIYSRGNTNISGACNECIKMFSNDKSNSIKVMLLLTDGIANKGIINSKELIDTFTPMLMKDEISMHTFGYGSDHDPLLLGELAKNCNGIYSYIKSKEDVIISFANCLGGIFSMCAKNIEFTLKLNPGIEYEVMAPDKKIIYDKDSNESLLVIGDISQDEYRDFVVSFSNDSDPENLSIGKYSIKYEDLINKSSSILTYEINIISVTDDAELTISQKAQFYDVLCRIDTINKIALIESISSVNKDKLVKDIVDDFIERVNKIKEKFTDYPEHLAIFDEYINTMTNIVKIQDRLDAKYLMRECSNGLSAQTSDGRTESTRRYKSGGRDKMIDKANKHFDFKINAARDHIGVDIDDPNEIAFFSRS